MFPPGPGGVFGATAKEWKDLKEGSDSGICEFAIDRHAGYTNLGFMDGSARKVGNKECWTLLWNRDWDDRNQYTVKGNNGSESAAQQAWNAIVPSWAKYKVY